MNYDLTYKQAQAVTAIKSFLVSKERIFTLEGISGSGKTFCLKAALKGYQGIIISTVSHSAKDIIAADFTKQGISAVFLTIAKLTGMTHVIDEDCNSIFIENELIKKLPIEHARILVIDECSMIPRTIHEKIISFLPEDSKVIYIGDPYQLPPVQEKDEQGNAIRLDKSIVFDYTKFKLHESVRYTGPIYDLGKRIRDEIDLDKSARVNVINKWMSEKGFYNRKSVINENGSGFIFINNLQQVDNIIRESMVSKTDLKLVAFRNKTVSQLNKYCRNIIYGNQELEPFMINEKIISDGSFGDNQQILNNQKFKVLGYSYVDYDYEGITIPCIDLSLEPKPALESVITVDPINGMELFLEQNRILKDLVKRNPYAKNKLISLRKTFAKFKYNYAENSHLSQGQTYDNVIVFERDIMSVQKSDTLTKLRSLYVACTRARNITFIFNSESRIDNSQVPEYLKNKYGVF